MFLPEFAHRLRSGGVCRAVIPAALLVLAVVALAACSGQAGPSAGAGANPTAPAGAAATTAPGGSSAGAVSFSKDVEPILQSRCITCHGGQQTQRGLDLTSYSGVMAGSVNGPVVVAGNPDGSLLMQMILQGKMPKRGPKLLPGQVQTLTDWIKSGAPDN